MPIQHIVFIIKENHSFDNYFGLFPGADGTTTGQVKINGVDRTIALGPFQDKPPDYPHAWSQARTTYDHGAMDLFNIGNCSASPTITTTTTSAMIALNSPRCSNWPKRSITCPRSTDAMSRLAT